MAEPHRSSPAELKERIHAERSGHPLLLYRDEEGRQRIVALTPERPRLYVGRHPSSDVPLPWDEEVSRVHADLESINGVWTVVDDGRSRNGSFVNGERLYGRRSLAHGDEITVGRTRLVFDAPAEQALRSTAPTVGRLGPPVSPAQRRVLVALCRPLAGDPFAQPPPNRRLAEELSISIDTVKSHLQALFDGFELGDVPPHLKRVALARAALDRGVVAQRELR
jgi:FHA domain